MFKKYIKQLFNSMKKKVSLTKIMGNQSGFTLIELIIVITVLGVIVAAFLPRTGGNVEKTKQVMHENLTNTITSAIAEYGTEYKLTPKSGGVEIKKTDISITPPASTDKEATLLRPIDKDHPLIVEGFLDKVPLNPWGSDKDFLDYQYIVDFKTTERKILNPDGTSGDFIKLIPVVKLAKVDKDSKEVVRNDIIVIKNGKTLTTTKDKASVVLSAYTFE